MDLGGTADTDLAARFFAGFAQLGLSLDYCPEGFLGVRQIIRSIGRLNDSTVCPTMSFTLTRTEQEILERLARTSGDPRLVRRVNALLELSAGASPAMVARHHRVVRSTIYNWLRRCRRGELTEAALRDRPRSGRPPRSADHGGQSSVVAVKRMDP